MDTLSENNKTDNLINPIKLSTEEDSTSFENLKKTKWISEENKKFIYSKKQNVTAFDVAEYILIKLGSLSTMKLHKLLYYCQAWSLVWDEKPLFYERIEAWANGPVIKDLFSFHKGYFSISNINIGNPNALNPTQKETIDSILTHYGDKSAQWLIELTHMEAPWKNARKGLRPTERGNIEITHESMSEYYSSL